MGHGIILSASCGSLAYLASWGAGLYLLAQCVFFGQARPKATWFVLWVCIWPAFVSGLLVTLAPLPPIWALGRIGIFAPFLWLISVYQFRKGCARRKPHGSPNVPQDETVWPPAPRL